METSKQVTALVVALMGSLAASTDPRPWNPWAPAVEVSVAGRYNPLGAALTLRPVVRYRLVPPTSRLRRTTLGDALLAPTSVGWLTQVDVNPAFARAGMGVEVTPAAVWRMRLLAQGTAYFGTFGHLVHVPRADSDYTPTALARRSSSGPHGGPGIATRLYGENLLQAKLSRLVAFDLATAEVYLHRGKGFVYNGEYDLLLASNGEAVVKNIAIGAVALVDQPRVPYLAAGLFHAVARAARSGGQNQQAGFAFILTPIVGARWASSLQVITLCGWHLQDRYRRGQPYLAVQVTGIP